MCEKATYKQRSNVLTLWPAAGCAVNPCMMCRPIIITLPAVWGPGGSAAGTTSAGQVPLDVALCELPEVHSTHTVLCLVVLVVMVGWQHGGDEMTAGLSKAYDTRNPRPHQGKSLAT